MAISKNKSDIIDNLINKEIVNYKYYNYGYYYYWEDYEDYEDYYDDGDDGYDHYYNNHDYVDEDFIIEHYIQKRRGISIKSSSIIGKKIDMKRAYSKQYLRQLKLNSILLGERFIDDKNYLVDNLSKESLDNLNKFYYLCNK